MGDTRFGLNVENFDLYFEKLAPLISQPAKEALPKDILYRLRKGKLTFFGKLWVLWKCLGKRWWLVVEEENGGLSVEDFVELREAIKRRDFGVPKAEGFISTGTFVTASKELADSFNYLNRLSTSPAYNFLQRAKNKGANKVAERKDQLLYICRFLSHWESVKKRIVSEMSLGIPEVLVLLYYYNGKEMAGSALYKEYYKRAYQSSPTKIKAAFGSLQSMRYLEKIGHTKGATFNITPLGTDIVNTLLSKYVLNC